MWPVLQELLRELLRLAMAVGLERVEQWRSACTLVLERERQRLFEALALLCLGLLMLAVGLSGLLWLAWWALPEPWRLPLMGVLLLLLSVAGLSVLSLARRRVARP